MTNEEKKLYLSSYRANEMEIARLEEELAEWESRASRVTASWNFAPGTGTPRANGPGMGFAFCVEQIAEYQQELRERLLDSLRLRRDIARAIAALPDIRLRELLSCRYIDGMTISATAERMCYSARQVDNLIVSALHKLDLAEQGRERLAQPRCPHS